MVSIGLVSALKPYEFKNQPSEMQMQNCDNGKETNPHVLRRTGTFKEPFEDYMFEKS